MQANEICHLIVEEFFFIKLKEFFAVGNCNENKMGIIIYLVGSLRFSIIIEIEMRVRH